MRDSGFVQIQTELVTASLNLPSASHGLEMMREAFGAYQAVVADLSDTEKLKASNEVYECHKQFEGVDGFRAQFNSRHVRCNSGCSLRAKSGQAEAGAISER